MSRWLIRPERTSDVDAIDALIAEAFMHAPHTSHTEQHIVRALRRANALTVALVGQCAWTGEGARASADTGSGECATAGEGAAAGASAIAGEGAGAGACACACETAGSVAKACGIIGCVAASPVKVSTRSIDGWFGLGPLAVCPDCQRRGLGAELTAACLAALRALGARGCVVLGEPTYYGRFGFRAEPQLVLAGVPPVYFQALAFDGPVPEGTVSYHDAFDATG